LELQELIHAICGANSGMGGNGEQYELTERKKALMIIKGLMGCHHAATIRK
jgi:hypothetical protein